MGLTNLKDVSQLTNLDVALSTRNAEITQALVKTDLDNILAKLDVNLSTRSQKTVNYDSQRLYTTIAQNNFVFPNPLIRFKIFTSIPVLVQFNNVANKTVYLEPRAKEYFFELTLTTLYFQALDEFNKGVFTVEGEY